MHKRNGKLGWMTLLVVATVSAVSLAQDAPARHAASGGRGAFGFMATLDRQVGLTPEQRDSVRGLLAAQHQKSQALREETDNKIRALLNPDQQQKFDQVLAEQKQRFSHRSQGA